MIASMLYGLNSWDPVTLMSSAALLIGVAIAAAGSLRGVRQEWTLCGLCGMNRQLFPRSPTGGRLLSLNIFGGMVIAAMILVTDPGTYAHTWHQLRHAEWNGATATDMIFPAFLFMVVLAIPFSLGSRAESGTTRSKTAFHIIRRSITLFLLGLAINGFPDYVWNTLHIPGILQRIAVCYALCGFLYLSMRERRQRDRTIVFASISVVLRRLLGDAKAH